MVVTIALLGACSESRDELDLRTDSESYAYKRDSEFSDVLKGCVLAATVADACTLDTLPFIGQRGAPDPANIMERVVVTHDWMATRFEEMLHLLPEDLLPLFGSTTAIFIGSYVNPSYYSTWNGAIHIDPRFLWLSREEKATISRKPDPRLEYGADLGFDAFRRFVLGQNNAWRNYSLTDESERQHADIRLGLSRVLYHELAHANDFMPHTVLGSVDTSLKVNSAVNSVRDSWVSRALSAEQPLNSDLLKSMALVRYRNNVATAEEQLVDAAYAGSLMQNDGANYFYGYYTEREDLAGLFEAIMMKLNFGVDMDFAFVSNPETDDPDCSEYVVGWGVRGRLGNPLVASRAAFVAERILADPQRVEAMLGEQAMTEQFMRPGDDWCENLILEDVSEVSSDKSSIHSGDMMRLREADGQLD
ncbi:MAG: hypothetical protein KTR32_19980 [Granulosicoccus sp.]|nr:hypothetical protein [Granulosicoccus sp.]